jgi:microcompartment protein CcmK/EutM
VKLSRVIGTVVLSKTIPSYEGKVLHLTQDLNEDLEPVGDPEVSATWQAMQEGNLVVVEVARESANAFDPPIAIDSVILAKVESAHLVKAGT